MSDLELLRIVQRAQRYQRQARRGRDVMQRHMQLTYAIAHYGDALREASRARLRQLLHVDVCALLGAALRDRAALAARLTPALEVAGLA